MVTVIANQKRETQEGKEFQVLIVANQKPELVKSKSGNQYLIVRKASIPCAFDETMAKQMVGLNLPGSIEKVPSEPYQFTLDDGKEVTLEHRYEYSETASSVEEAVFEEVA